MMSPETAHAVRLKKRITETLVGRQVQDDFKQPWRQFGSVGVAG